MEKNLNQQNKMGLYDNDKDKKKQQKTSVSSLFEEMKGRQGAVTDTLQGKPSVSSLFNEMKGRQAHQEEQPSPTDPIVDLEEEMSKSESDFASSTRVDIPQFSLEQLSQEGEPVRDEELGGVNYLLSSQKERKKITRGLLDTHRQRPTEAYLQQKETNEWKQIGEQGEKRLTDEVVAEGVPEEKVKEEVVSRAAMEGYKYLSEDELARRDKTQEFEKLKESGDFQGANKLRGEMAAAKTFFIDPGTGQRFIQPETKEQETHVEAVTSEMERLKQTDEERWKDIYLEYYYRKSEMEKLYDDKAEVYAEKVDAATKNLTYYGREAAGARVGEERLAEKETNLKRYRKLYHDAEAKFEAVSKMYLGNTDPASVKKDLGYAAGQFGKAVLTGLLPEKLHDVLPRTKRDVLDASSELFTETGEAPTQEQTDKFKRTWGESLNEFTGGITGILVPLGVAGKALKGVEVVTGLNKVVKAWKSGSKIKKLAAGVIDVGMEELKFSLIGGAPGAGAGFGLAGKLKTGIVLPKRLKWAQPLVNIATGAGGATIGMETAKAAEAVASSLLDNKEFDVEFEKHFGDLSTNEGVKDYLRDLSVTAVGNLLYSGANISLNKALEKVKPPESLTPKEVTEAKKLFMEEMLKGEEKLLEKPVEKKEGKKGEVKYATQEGKTKKEREELHQSEVKDAIVKEFGEKKSLNEEEMTKKEVDKKKEIVQRMDKEFAEKEAKLKEDFEKDLEGVIPDNLEYTEGRKQAGEKLLIAIEKSRKALKETGKEDVRFEDKARNVTKDIIKIKPRVDKDHNQVINKKELDEYERLVKKDLIETEEKLKGFKEKEAGKKAGAVVDEKGAPIIMYQGRSKKGITSLFNKGEGWFSRHKGIGVQFADPELHAKLSDTPEKYKDIKNEELKGEVHAVNLDIKNPMKVDLKETMWDRHKERAKIKEAKEKGHDGLIITENGEIRDAVVFNENQIKRIEKTPKEAGEEKLDIRKSVGAAIEGFSEKASKELKDIGVLFSGGKFTKKVKPEGKIKFGIQKKNLKQEKRRIEVIRSILKDVIKDNEAILKRIHGRTVPAIMRKLENSITVRSMNRAIDYIEKVVKDKKTQEELIRKENSLADIEKRVKKKTHFTKGLTRNRIKYPDSKTFEAMVDRVAGKRGKEGISDIIKNKNPEKTLEEIQALEAQLENPGITEEQIIKIQNRLQDLGFSGLYDMPAKQVEGKLSELKDIIKGATKEGIAENKARIEADVKEYDWFVDILAKKKFEKGEVVSQEEPMTDQTKINKLPERKREWYNPFGGFMNNVPVILDKLSKNDPLRGKTFDNQLHWKIMPKIWEGQASYAEHAEMFNKKLEDKRNEIFKPKNDKDMRRILKNNAVASKAPFKAKVKSRLNLQDRALTEKVEFKNEDTGEMDYIDLNQNIAAKYWLMLQDPTLDNTFFKEITHDSGGLQKGMGWGDSHVKVIEDYLTPEMKKWSEYLLNEYYPQVYDIVNKTYREINGTDLNYNEFYTNISREGVEKSSSIEETMAGEPMLSAVHNGSLLNRTGSTLPLRGEDVNRSMLAYTEKMLYYASWAEPVRYMQKMFRNPRVKNAIKQWHTSDPINHMNREIDMMANKREKQVIGHKLVNTIRKRFIIGTIGMKGTVFVKQLFSQPAYLVSLGAKNTVKAVANFMANPKKQWDITMENPEARRRFEGAGGDADVVYAMAKDFRKGGGTKDWVKFYMTNVRYGDITPIVVGYPKLYEMEYNKAKKTMSAKDAKKYAQKAAWENTNLWQQSSETPYLSPMQLGNPYIKLFTMYMTAPISYHRQATRALGNLASDVKRGRHKTSGGRKIMRNHVKRFVVAHIVLPQLFTYAMNGLQWENDEQLRALFVGNINNLPIVGDILDYALDELQGKPFDYAPTPTGSAAKYSVRLIKMIAKMMDEEEKNVEVRDILDVTSDVASTTTGVPATGVYNTVEGAADVLKGETQYPFRRILGFSEYELQEGAKKKEERRRKKGKSRAR